MGNLTMTMVKYFSDTRGSARYLLYTIADSVSDETGYYDLSVASLATYTRFTPRYINKLLAALLKSGELVCIERAGNKKQNRYMIPLYPGEPGYNPLPCSGTEHSCSGNHTPFARTRYELYTEFFGGRKVDALRAVRDTLNHRTEPPQNSDTLNNRTEPTLNYRTESHADTLNNRTEPTLNHSSDKPIVTHRDQKPNNKPIARARADVILEMPKQKPDGRAETAETDPTPLPPAPPRTPHQEFTAWLAASGYREVPGQRMTPVEKRQYEDRSYTRRTHQDVMAAFLATRQGVAV